jgi:hypothetical protein
MLCEGNRQEMKHKAVDLWEIPETKIKVKRFAPYGNYILIFVHWSWSTQRKRRAKGGTGILFCKKHDTAMHDYKSASESTLLFILQHILNESIRT